MKLKNLLILTIICLIVFLTSCQKTQTIVNNNYYYETGSESYSQNSLEDTVIKTVKNVEKSVINIEASNKSILDGIIGTAKSLGTGVIYERTASLINDDLGEVNGNISYYTYKAITNNHVIQTETGRNYNNIIVTFTIDDLSAKAKVIENSMNLDAAIIEFKTGLCIEPSPIGDSENINKGQFIIAIGNNLGLAHTVTMGIISATSRIISVEGTTGMYFQHDASINSGNSGGPAFNLKGEIIGINTTKMSDVDDVSVDGMSFAIHIHRIINDLTKE